MKRASLISVVLTVALAIACSTSTNDTNKNNSYIGPGTANPDLVTIAVVVVQDPLKTDPMIEVTYPSYAVKQIQWCVYNDTKAPVSVSFAFPLGSPCKINPPALIDIPAGNNPAVCTACDCITTAKEYPYQVEVTTAGGRVINADPRVILN